MCAASKSRSGSYLKEQKLLRKKNAVSEQETKKIDEVDDKLVGDDRELGDAQEIPDENQPESNLDTNY